jgi:hypothetical protein
MSAIPGAVDADRGPPMAVPLAPAALLGGPAAGHLLAVRTGEPATDRPDGPDRDEPAG